MSVSLAGLYLRKKSVSDTPIFEENEANLLSYEEGQQSLQREEHQEGDQES